MFRYVWLFKYRFWISLELDMSCNKPYNNDIKYCFQYILGSDK